MDYSVIAVPSLIIMQLAKTKSLIIHFQLKIITKKCTQSGNSWSIYPANFDNIFNSMVTVFILSTQEGWPTIMYYAMDSNDETIVNSFLISY